MRGIILNRYRILLEKGFKNGEKIINIEAYKSQEGDCTNYNQLKDIEIPDIMEKMVQIIRNKRSERKLLNEREFIFHFFQIPDFIDTKPLHPIIIDILKFHANDLLRDTDLLSILNQRNDL